MQILSHEEAEERYGLTKEDLSEFQQESHVAIAKPVKWLRLQLIIMNVKMTQRDFRLLRVLLK